MKVIDLVNGLKGKDPNDRFIQDEAHSTVGFMKDMLHRCELQAEIEAWSLADNGVICAVRIRPPNGTSTWVDIYTRPTR